jgi:hypothetical protein
LLLLLLLLWLLLLLRRRIVPHEAVWVQRAVLAADFEALVEEQTAP